MQAQNRGYFFKHAPLVKKSRTFGGRVRRSVHSSHNKPFARYLQKHLANVKTTNQASIHFLDNSQVVKFGFALTRMFHAQRSL